MESSNNNFSEYVSRFVSTDTIKMLEKIKDQNIYPEFNITLFKETSNKKYNDWSLKIKKYDIDLGDYIDDLVDKLNRNITLEDLAKIGDIPNKINNLICKLHNNGILHGDLHAKNIVLNIDTMDLRIIDIGQYIKGKGNPTKWINEISQKDIDFYNSFWDTKNNASKKLETTEELLEHEKIMWMIGYVN